MTPETLRKLHRAIANAETAGTGIADLAAEGLIPLDTAVADLRSVFTDMLKPVREEIAKEMRRLEGIVNQKYQPALDESPRRKFSPN